MDPSRSHVRALDGTGFASISPKIGWAGDDRPLVPTPHQPASFCEAKDIFFLGLNVSNNRVIINRKRGGDYVNLLIANVEGLALERP